MRADGTGGDASRTVEDLLELYAIDALPDAEARAFERALDVVDEPTRRRAVREMQSTRDAVSRWAAEVEEAPDPRLRERVLAAVDQGVPVGQGAGGDRAAGDVDELAARRARRRRVAVRVCTAAAAVLLVVGGVLIGRSTVSAPADGPTIAQGDQLSALQTVLGREDVQLRRSAVSGRPGTVVVASSRSADQAVVVFDGAPRPPDRRVYQLWLIGSVSVRSAAVVDAASSSAPVVVSGLRGAETIGLTIEPDGGSPQPTGPVLVDVAV